MHLTQTSLLDCSFWDMAAAKTTPFDLVFASVIQEQAYRGILVTEGVSPNTHCSLLPASFFFSAWSIARVCVPEFQGTRGFCAYRKT